MMTAIARSQGQVGAGEPATRGAHTLRQQSVSDGVRGASLVQEGLTLAATGDTGESNNAPAAAPVRPLSRVTDGHSFGQIPEFEDRVLLVNNKHAVEKYLTTTKFLVKYVGKHYA